MRTGEPSTLSCVLALKLPEGAAASTYVSATEAKLRTSAGGASAMPARSTRVAESDTRANRDTRRARRDGAGGEGFTTAYPRIHPRGPVMSRQKNNFMEHRGRPARAYRTQPPNCRDS